MYEYMYVCMCVYVCMYVCMYIHMYVCMQSVTVITFHHISCPMFCTKENTVSSKQAVYALCHDVQCVQIYICFHELFVTVVVTNKDTLVHISLLIFISALLFYPQAEQLYFIPGTGRNVSYHHLVQTDIEVQPGSYVQGARGSNIQCEASTHIHVIPNFEMCGSLSPHPL